MKNRKMRKILLMGVIFLLLPLLPFEEPGETVEAAGYHVLSAADRSFEDATDDWEILLERLDKAIRNGSGQNVNYYAGNRFVIPEGILGMLAGKNATLGLHASNGTTFSLSGQDIKTTDKPLSMEVVFEPEIPEAAIGQLEKYQIVKQFYMVEKDGYPCRVNVHMALGEENVGKHAVLYYYDEESGGMQQEGIYRITRDGHAIFGLKRGDEYAVVIMRGYTVASGDTFSHIARKHGVSLQELQAVNPQISNIDKIQIGQQINIPNV